MIVIFLARNHDTVYLHVDDENAFPKKVNPSFDWWDGDVKNYCRLITLYGGNAFGRRIFLEVVFSVLY